MEARGVIYLRYNLLAENSANIIRRIGLGVFLVNIQRDVLIFYLVDFQVKNF